MNINDICFKLQYSLPIEYKGKHLDCGYRLDILVENEIILELKSIEKLQGIHTAQLLTYMKLLNIKQCFFNQF